MPQDAIWFGPFIEDWRIRRQEGMTNWKGSSWKEASFS